MMAKELMINYKNENKTILIGYTALLAIFYIINGIFFRTSVDAPVDLIFSAVFIIVIPGLVTFITMMKRGSVFFDSNKEYAATLFVYGITPIIMSVIALLIYQMFRIYDTPILTMIALHGISFPMIFVAFIIAFEIYGSFQFILFKLLGLIVLVAVYFVVMILFSDYEYYRFTQVVNVIVLFLLPFFMIVFPYRKQNIFSNKKSGVGI